MNRGDSTKDLPMLPCIHDCKVESIMDSRLSLPSSAADVLAQLPNVETLRIRSWKYLLEVTILAPEISAGKGWDDESAGAEGLSS